VKDYEAAVFRKKGRILPVAKLSFCHQRKPPSTVKPLFLFAATTRLDGDREPDFSVLKVDEYAYVNAIIYLKLKVLILLLMLLYNKLPSLEKTNPFTGV